jgi:restriction system protein
VNSEEPSPPPESESGTDALVREVTWWGPPHMEGGRLIIPIDWDKAPRVERPIPDDEDGSSLSDSDSESSSSSERSAPSPEIVIPFELTLSGRSGAEGLIIESVAIAWDALIREIAEDSDFLYRISPRELEELVAARYDASGWNVTLTPRSADGGRDIIAVHKGLRIRIYDEVKRYRPGTKIDAQVVRALYGVVARDGNVSKGLVTTTADFAPGIETEFAHEIPYRLELRNGRQLAEWMAEAARLSGKAGI